MLKIIQAIMQLTGRLSPNLSASIALYLFSRPRRFPDSEREKVQLDQARKIHYQGALGTVNTAWSWGEGPVVILCHGWEAKAAKMAALAMVIAGQGFQAVAMDASAHGHSGGKRCNFDIMAKDIHALAGQFPEVFAIVGHSMGGMMAMRAREFGLKAQRYVVLGSPSAPLPIIEIMKAMLKVSPETAEICQDRVAAQIGLTWQELLQCKMYTPEDTPLLMIYDTEDDEVPIFHGERIHKTWPAAELVKTTGLGHRKLVWDIEVIQTVLDFLGQERHRGQIVSADVGRLA
ncbi:alpha/beta hydrolase [Microbulbifer sp. OS29]|uniref:Alpha/beta hydrolase n=1 Tax=Microbulbifer okhotskensis TaxID=2926617 RepID=A0A9X2ENU4_9GAMM|nr:alpha/beta hydrolase [Microbulbifer okhotskensis]MCO1335677.1 alpha/beta hydrolase [Microbulbifer okhotskensis]